MFWIVMRPQWFEQHSSVEWEYTSWCYYYCTLFPYGSLQCLSLTSLLLMGRFFFIPRPCCDLGAWQFHVMLLKNLLPFWAECHRLSYLKIESASQDYHPLWQKKKDLRGLLAMLENVIDIKIDTKVWLVFMPFVTYRCYSL